MKNKIQKFLPLYSCGFYIKNWSSWWISFREENPKPQEDRSASILMYFIGSIIFIFRRISLYENLRHLFYIPFSDELKYRVPASFTDWYILLRLFFILIVCFFLTIPNLDCHPIIGYFIIFLIFQKLVHNFFNLFWRYQPNFQNYRFHAHNHVRNVILSFIAYIEIILLFALCYWFSLRTSFNEINTFVDFFYYSVVTSSTLGFGDILPKTDKAKLLTTFQVLSSLLMLGSIIARAVSIVFLPRESIETKEEITPPNTQ